MLEVNEEFLESLSLADLQVLAKTYREVNDAGFVVGLPKHPGITNAELKYDLVIKAIEAKVLKYDQELFIDVPQEEQSVSLNMH